MRSNSRGIVVSHEPIERAIDDLKDYIWSNWPRLERIGEGTISVTYEIPYRDLEGVAAMMPVEFVITEGYSDFEGAYDPESNSIVLAISVEDLDRHWLVYRPFNTHPRWPDLRTYLTKNLVHEITHAVERSEEISKRANQYNNQVLANCVDASTPECLEAFKQYYNTPIEVSAVTNEIVYEIVRGSEGTLPPRVEDALALSETWSEIGPMLTVKNKNLVYKRVYTRLYTGEVTL